jgi:hypothetical protein
MRIDVNIDNKPGDWDAALKFPKPKTIKKVLLEFGNRLLKGINNKIKKGNFCITKNPTQYGKALARWSLSLKSLETNISYLSPFAS